MPSASFTMANGMRFSRRFGRRPAVDTRHSSHAQRAFRNSRSRSFGRKRSALARSNGFSLASVRIPSVQDVREDRSGSFPSSHGSHRAITEQSTPACSSSIAALWRKTWGDTRFERRVTQCSRPLATYLFSSACTPSALSLPPCVFGKRAVAPRFLGSLSQPRRACCATLVSGVLRSLRPLPTHRT